MPNITEITASILADAFFELSTKTNVGILAENLPKFDVAKFIEELGAKYDAPLWLAILGGTDNSLTSTEKIDLTYDVTVANQWRNLATEKKDKKLFVLVLGPVPKLKSLKDLLDRLTENELCPVIEQRAISWHPTEDRKVFWKYICSQRDTFKTNSLLEFLTEMNEVAVNSPTDLSTYEEKALYKLGMFPHSNLLDQKAPKTLGKAVKSNLSLVERIKELSKSDIQKISKILEDETVSDEERKVIRGILTYSRTKNKEVLNGIEYQDVSKVFAAKKQPDNPDVDTTSNPVRKEKELGDESIIKDLIYNEGKNIDAIAERYDFSNNDGECTADEFVIEGRAVIKKYRNGTAQNFAALNLLVTQDSFGGLIWVQSAPDYVECLKSIEGGESTFTYNLNP